jgi:hypothetical protein
MNEKYFDKEKFLKEIHTIPYWVKNGDDLLKFCKHLQYRLLQATAKNSWYEKNLDLNDDDHIEVNRLYRAYEDVYNNDASEFQPFEQIFIEK